MDSGPDARMAGVVRAATVAAAVDALADGTRRVVAGGTWLMRAPLRGEEPTRAGVLVGSIPELSTVSIEPDRATLGAALTHADIVAAVTDAPALKGLVTAAGNAANPQVRSVATLGGNLCTSEFASADLVPQFLALDATVDVAGADGATSLGLRDFLAMREACFGLLVRVHVPLGQFRSAHARLPLRKAGDYPVATVSANVSLSPDGMIERARIAVGAVEAVARRWERLEAELVGMPVDPGMAAETSAALTNDFRGRDGIEAPGWYRTKVLPALVRKAFEDLASQMTEAA